MIRPIFNKQNTHKQIYFEKSRADNDRYMKEIELYLPKFQAPSKKKKQKKHPQAPKHPTSAYLYFVSENRGRIKTEFPTN